MCLEGSLLLLRHLQVQLRVTIALVNGCTVGILQDDVLGRILGCLAANAIGPLSQTTTAARHVGRRNATEGNHNQRSESNVNNKHTGIKKTCTTNAQRLLQCKHRRPLAKWLLYIATSQKLRDHLNKHNMVHHRISCQPKRTKKKSTTNARPYILQI